MRLSPVANVDYFSNVLNINESVFNKMLVKVVSANKILVAFDNTLDHLPILQKAQHTVLDTLT